LEAPTPRLCPGGRRCSGDGQTRKYSDELRERAVRFYFESDRPIAHVARDLGIDKEALRQWVRQAEADQGRRPELLTTSEREELKRLRKEVAELRRANAILKDASVYFATELDRARMRGERVGEQVVRELGRGA
jgi:transposase